MTNNPIDETADGRAMAEDKLLFPLDAEGKWRLACDGLQWIVQRARGRRKGGARAGEEVWQGQHYFTRRNALLSRLRELGVPLTAAAEGSIKAFPPIIQDWFKK